MFKLESLDIDYLKYKARHPEKTPSGKLRSTIIRARNILKILERDKFKCVNCPNKEELTIDHPDGRKFSKHDNHVKYKLEKCRTLCVPCHIKRNENNQNDKEADQKI